METIDFKNILKCCLAQHPLFTEEKTEIPLRGKVIVKISEQVRDPCGIRKGQSSFSLQIFPGAHPGGKKARGVPTSTTLSLHCPVSLPPTPPQLAQNAWPSSRIPPPARAAPSKSISTHLSRCGACPGPARSLSTCGSSTGGP